MTTDIGGNDTDTCLDDVNVQEHTFDPTNRNSRLQLKDVEGEGEGEVCVSVSASAESVMTSEEPNGLNTTDESTGQLVLARVRP